jgi:hypothetical protein
MSTHMNDKTVKSVVSFQTKITSQNPDIIDST